MLRRILLSGLGLAHLGLATPSCAGLMQDVADCKSAASAAACSRVMASGRLPHSQTFIAYYNRGWAHRKAGRHRDALADFDKVAKINPGFADTYFSRGLTQHDLGAYDASLAEFNRYIALKPQNWAAYLNRALVFRKLKQPDNALSDLQKAADLKPDAHEVPLMRALAVSDKGDHGAARVALDGWIADRPKDAVGYYARAIVSFREKNLESAMADLDKSLAIEEGFTAAHTLMGRVLEARGDTASARNRYERALSGPAKLVDNVPARATAKERLAALSSGKGGDGAVAMAEPETRTCSRFVAGANMTVRVDCDD